MKKLLRITALITALLTLCMLFTGCNHLDTLKEEHAIYNDDRSITYKGNTYVKLYTENDSTFTPFTNDDVTVTNPGIPVLLSRKRSAYRGEITDDGSIMALTTGYWYDGKECSVFYCRADVHEEATKTVQGEFEPEVYCYRFDYYEEDGDKIPGTYTLTKEEMAAIDKTIATDPQDDFDLSYKTSVVTLYSSTKDQRYNFEFADLYKIRGGYILTDSQSNTYKVPAEDNAIFDKIMQQQIMAKQSYDRAFGDR